MSKTTLYELHRQAGAQIVDFNGWEMPIHYGSQMAEHKKVRCDIGMFDVSHMNITDIEGSDSNKFLRHILTCDVTTLTQIGQANYSLLLNPTGGIIDDLIVYRMPAGFRIVSNCGTREKVNSWLVEQAVTFQKLILKQRNDLSIIAVQGPKAFVNLFQVIYTKYEGTRDFGLLHHQFEFSKDSAPFTSRLLGDIHLSRTGYTGEDGFEIILPHALATKLWQDLLENKVQPCGLGARDTLRLEAGMALYGQDMDEDTTPKESRLNWALNLKDPQRLFIGREASQTRAVRFCTRSFVTLGQNIARPGQALFLAGQDNSCGTVTSGSFSPSLSRGIGYCRIPPNTDFENFEVAIRKQKKPIQLTKGPFFKNNRATFIALETQPVLN